MLPALLLACGPPDPVRVRDTGTPEPVVELLSVALEARCPGVEPAEDPPGDDLHRVTLAEAEAACNDGTPPVLFVRAATDPAHGGDWVVHVDGGSSCSDHESCAVRWCGEDRYDAGKMSSAWSRTAIGADGMRSRDSWNSFAGWNHALLHYCSSDFWTGTREHVFEGDPAYRIRFEGNDILLAAIDALEDSVVSDNGVETLPPLGEAATVLFTGSSAGAFGVGEHLSEVTARLPSTRVIGVIDSFLLPPMELLTASEQSAREGSIRATWDDYLSPTWGGAMDPACLASNAEPWRCSDLDVVLRGGQPFELAFHQDLFDPVLYPNWQALGFGQLRFTELSAETLGLYADTLPGAGLHGSRCPHHTALSERAWFSDLRVEDDLGVSWSLHDLLAAQVDGTPIVAIDDPTGARSTCP